MSKLFTTILPSLLAGGLLFGSALTGAQPAPPAPPTSPTPPKPPKAPKVKADIHIDLGDINEVVDEQIKNALEAIGDNPQIPPHVREAMKQRLEKVRIKVKKRVAKISPNDLEQVGEELGKMGEEIGEEMEQFGKDMEKWGKEFEKRMDKQLKGKKVVVWKGQDHGTVTVDVDDDDDDDDLPGMDDMDDTDDLDDAIKDMGKLNLDAKQRASLKQLREASDATVANAKRQLETASDKLRTQLENGNASDEDVVRSIDQVTRLESDIRKARILAWVKARRILDNSQRQKVEAAARGKSR
jgi:hypothetical protein